MLLQVQVQANYKSQQAVQFLRVPLTSVVSAAAAGVRPFVAGPAQRTPLGPGLRVRRVVGLHGSGG
jgi:hypothetical protein